MIDHTAITTPPHGTLELIAELAVLERQEFGELKAAGLAGVAAWHPTNEGDDADDADDDADDKSKSKGKGDADDDKSKSKGKGDADDDDVDDDDNSDLARARKATAAANRELKKMRDDAADAKTAADKEAGKWKELYEADHAELEKLKGEVTTSAKGRLVEAAATKLKAKNAASVAKLIDLSEVEDDADAERAVKRLAKSDPYLFNEAKTRQKRGAGNRTDDDEDDDRDERDDEDDDRDRRRKPKAKVNRLRRGLEASSSK